MRSRQLEHAHVEGASKMSREWYALWSKPNREEALCREATARGFEVYLPRIRVHPVNPRARKVKPYFPGYMFVKTDPTATGWSALAWIPYSKGLVSFSSQPNPVPDRLVSAIRGRVDDLNGSDGEPAQQFRRGDVVRVEAGPFAGYDAVFEAGVSGAERVRVLLRFLSKQQVPLDLPAAYIQRKSRS